MKTMTNGEEPMGAGKDETGKAAAAMTPGTAEAVSPSAPGKPRGSRKNPGSGPSEGENAGLGSALRAVYQRTVEEDIPEEMLDLLKRLG